MSTDAVDKQRKSLRDAVLHLRTTCTVQVPTKEDSFIRFPSPKTPDFSPGDEGMLFTMTTIKNFTLM